MTPNADGLTDLAAMDYSVVQQCMHCGMCLPVCPTYDLTKRERHSPRGRIALMRAVADGELTIDESFTQEMSFCLGCLACQTACPAAVDYARLFETARAAGEAASEKWRPLRQLYRWASLRVLFRYPRLLRAFGQGMGWAQRRGLMDWLLQSGWIEFFPKRWRRMMKMTPIMSEWSSDALISQQEYPRHACQYRVGLLTGCVQDIAYAEINRDTADVLLENHCEVVTPRLQHCCGSIHGHNGDVRMAREMARKNIDAFSLNELDAIITNAGGCGSHLRHYSRLLADDPRYAERARMWDGKVRDIHEWLVAIGVRPPADRTGGPLRVAYHESCHLSHGQRVVEAPRQILQGIPGITLVPLTEADWCCGSAGVYSITQPETSDWLLQRKVAHVLACRPDVVATANPGCDLQLKRGLEEAGYAGIRVAAPVSLLAAAYRDGSHGLYEYFVRLDSDDSER